MVLNIASNIKTRQIVWVRNGAKTQSGPAYVWAGLAREGKL
jgi:hypothetical protein